MGMAYIIAVGGKVGMGIMVSVGVYTKWVSVITHHSRGRKGRHGDDGLCRGIFTMG